MNEITRRFEREFRRPFRNRPSTFTVLFRFRPDRAMRSTTFRPEIVEFTYAFRFYYYGKTTREDRVSFINVAVIRRERSRHFLVEPFRHATPSVGTDAGFTAVNRPARITIKTNHVFDEFRRRRVGC